MTLLENLQAHKGGLLRLKTELFWYGNRVWDRNPGRICLIIDAADTELGVAVDTVAATSVAAAAATTAADHVLLAAVLLLIEGQLRWIRVFKVDVELISEAG